MSFPKTPSGPVEAWTACCPSRAQLEDRPSSIAGRAPGAKSADSGAGFATSDVVIQDVLNEVGLLPQFEEETDCLVIDAESVVFARGAATQAVLISVYETLRLRDLNPTITIADALKAYLTTGHFPPLPDSAIANG